MSFLDFDHYKVSLFCYKCSHHNGFKYFPVIYKEPSWMPYHYPDKLMSHICPICRNENYIIVGVRNFIKVRTPTVYLKRQLEYMKGLVFV